jgi:hypothetical protein
VIFSLCYNWEIAALKTNQANNQVANHNGALYRASFPASLLVILNNAHLWSAATVSSFQ